MRLQGAPDPAGETYHTSDSLAGFKGPHHDGRGDEKEKEGIRREREGEELDG